jgi:drug/metabolite transporter (DMT)-like permease
VFRFSNRELAPLWGASLRFALAAALLLAVMVLLGLAFPRGRALVGSLLHGLFNIGAGFGLIYYGLVQVHAGLAQILLALVPLATLLLAVVGGAICFAQALVLVRRFPSVHPVTMNAIGITAGAAVLLAASLVADEPILLPHRRDMGGHGLPGCDRLGGRLPAVLGRSPVLDGVTSVLRIRHHPVRYRRALGLA